MKRIAENVALDTISYILPGDTKIVIEDRKLRGTYWIEPENTVRWEGLVKNFYKSDNAYKWGRSKVYHMEHTPDHILLVISTEFEEY